MSPVLLSGALAVTAGWTDTVIFFALGIFAAHVTGNIVLVFDALRHAGPDVTLGALTVPVFIVAAWLAALLGEWAGPQRRATLRLLFAIEAALLALSLVLGVTTLHGDAAAPGPIAAGMLAVAAMAVQNAANRLLLPGLPSTAVMTSNVSQMVVDLAAITRSAERAKALERLRKFVPAVLAFAVGCALAAGAYALVGFWALAVPLVMLVAISATVEPVPA